jgi:DNA polymerase IV
MNWHLHLDMDAFFVSVERVLDPSLRGKPVIVGGRSGRGVVTSASYEARKFGVRSAMPGFQAKKLCPAGVFLPNRHRLYRDYSKKVFAILDHYSPVVYPLSIDEGLVDLTGTEKLLGPPLRTADQIVRRITDELGLPASGGLSENPVVAKIAATLAKPHGLIYVPGGAEEDFLSRVAVELIPGIGPKTHKTLLQQGIKTIGDLLRHNDLASRYLSLKDATNSDHHHDRSIGNETTLDKPIQERGKMEMILWELVEEVGARLRREKFYARRLTLKIRYTDFCTVTRSRTLSTPTCFDRDIFTITSALLRKAVVPDRAVRLLGVSASALRTGGWQEPLFDRVERGSWEKLYRGLDELRRKYGTESIGVATPRLRIG